MGASIVFLVWAVRATIKHVLSVSGDGPRDNIWIPVGIYGFQSVGRALIYQLHRTGVIFTPRKWLNAALQAKDITSYEMKHIMSDHILLSASVISGLSCEAALIYMSLAHRRHPWSPAALKLCAAFGIVLAALVCFESFYTARYFHPPEEIVTGAIIGLVVFQLPILIFVARLLQRHERVHGGGEEEDDDYVDR